MVRYRTNVTRSGFINVYSPPVASFTTNITSGWEPLTVQFTDTSANTPTSWNWSFGDGITSTLQNPTHTYPNMGSYPVNLTVTNSAGSSISLSTITVTAASSPVANFAANLTLVPEFFPIQFTDQSTG